MDPEDDVVWLRQLLDVLPVPVIVFAPDGRVLFANQARRDFAGNDVVSLEGAIHRTAPEREDGTPVPREKLPAVRALNGEQVIAERMRLHAADGHSEVMLVSAVPLRGRVGDVVGAAVVFQDITDISELERGRRELFSMANHDLRTPLTVIIASVQLTRRVLASDPDRAARTMSDIERQAQRMLRLIQDLLDVARFEAGTIPIVAAPVDLRDRLRGAVERQTARDRFELVTPPVPVTVPVDEDRLDQVLDNLLSNALRHTNPGTRVEVSLEPQSDQVVVRVRDRGRGIEPDERARLFKPFYQTPRGRSYGGTGLGLNISRRIIEAHGGRLWLEQTSSSGSTFTFALPLEGPPQHS